MRIDAAGHCGIFTVFLLQCPWNNRLPDQCPEYRTSWADRDTRFFSIFLVLYTFTSSSVQTPGFQKDCDCCVKTLFYNQNIPGGIHDAFNLPNIPMITDDAAPYCCCPVGKRVSPKIPLFFFHWKNHTKNPKNYRIYTRFWWELKMDPYEVIAGVFRMLNFRIYCTRISRNTHEHTNTLMMDFKGVTKGVEKESKRSRWQASFKHSLYECFDISREFSSESRHDKSTCVKVDIFS